MSHFSVTVVTKTPEIPGQEDAINEALQPYHEFECTGTVDKYVQSVDQLEDMREAYEKSTTSRYKDTEGKIHDKYGDQFYREPTEEERTKLGPHAFGSGWGSGLHYTSKDWGDGKGYRYKIHFIPEGWSEVDVPTKDLMTFAKYIEYETNRKPVLDGQEPDLENVHKYGWYRLAADLLTVTECVHRTNPNKKWDWHVIGGRWDGHLKLKDGSNSNNAKKSDIDFDRMRKEAGIDAGAKYDKIFLLIKDDISTFIPWATIRDDVQYKDKIDEARKVYHAQPAQQKLSANRDSVFLNVEDFLVTREEYVQKAEKSAVHTFAFLKDGQWSERGKMHMFGIVSGENDNWEDSYEKLLATVADDEYITIVDCHI